MGNPNPGQRIIAGLAVCAMLVLSLEGHGADWPQFRGPDRNGISKETGLLKSWPAEGPKVLWAAGLGQGYSSVAVAGGRVFTMFQDARGQYAAAFDEQTGKELWPKVKLGEFYKDHNGYLGPRATPTVEGEFVYFHDATGNLACLTASDGKVVWKKNILELAGATNLFYGMAGSPYLVGDMILINPGGQKALIRALTQKTGIMALNKKTGDVIWKAGDDVAGYSTVVPFKEDYLIFDATGVVCFTKEGKILWRFPLTNSVKINETDPIPSDDWVFCCTGYDKGCAVYRIEGNQPRKVWEGKHFMNNFGSTPILLDGYLYGTNEPKKLECLEYQTGAVKWQQDLSSKCQLTYADGMFYLFGVDGTLSLARLTPEKGEIVSTVKILPGRWCLTPPVIANGKLYVRNDQKLLCLDVRQ